MFYILRNHREKKPDHGFRADMQECQVNDVVLYQTCFLFFVFFRRINNTSQLLHSIPELFPEL